MLVYDEAGAERGNRHKITKTLSSYDADARAALDFLAVKAQLWCEKFREQGEYVGPSGFVDFTQAFDQSALVHGPNLI